MPEDTYSPDDVVTAADDPRIYQETTEYAVSLLPPDHPRRRHYEIRVKRQRNNLWTVEHVAQFWANRAGEWSVKCSGPHVVDHHFDLDDALDLARRLAPDIEGGNNRTAAETLALPTDGMRG